MKEENLHVFDWNLVQEMWKTVNNTYIGGTEELDKYLSTEITTENDLEKQVDLFQKLCNHHAGVPSKSLTQGRRTTIKICTLVDRQPQYYAETSKRLQETIPENKKLREGREQKYIEEKRKYQARIKHEKMNSWKEFCNATASKNTWSQVYKLA